MVPARPAAAGAVPPARAGCRGGSGRGAQRAGTVRGDGPANRPAAASRGEIAMVVRRVAIIAGLLIVLGAVGWGYRWSRSEWIEAGHVGVMYAARTGLEHRLYTPQRIFVPWFHQLYTYPTLTQAAIYTQDPSHGEQA